MKENKVMEDIPRIRFTFIDKRPSHDYQLSFCHFFFVRAANYEYIYVE